MSKIIRYTKTGHCFEIEGCMDAGYTIIVTVKPKDGYKFVQWLNCDAHELTEHDPDGYQRFELDIKECGYSFAALFEPGSYTPPSDPTPSTPDTYQVSWNTGAGYTVSATADGVTFSKGAVVAPGKNVTITVKANSGYNLGDLSLSGVNETFTGGSTSKSVNFIMPSANVVATINAAQQQTVYTYYYCPVSSSNELNFNNYISVTSVSQSQFTVPSTGLGVNRTVFLVKTSFNISNVRVTWVNELGQQFLNATIFTREIANIPSGYKAYMVSYSSRPSKDVTILIS